MAIDGQGRDKIFLQMAMNCMTRSESIQDLDVIARDISSHEMHSADKEFLKQFYKLIYCYIQNGD